MTKNFPRPVTGLRTILLAAMTLIVLAVPTTASAHHGNSSYMNCVGEYCRGTVDQFPHYQGWGWLHVIPAASVGKAGTPDSQINMTNWEPAGSQWIKHVDKQGDYMGQWMWVQMSSWNGYAWFNTIGANGKWKGWRLTLSKKLQLRQRCPIVSAMPRPDGVHFTTTRRCDSGDLKSTIERSPGTVVGS